MDEFVECKHCGGELRFVQMDEEHTHKWKAECTKCKTKKGTAMFNDWISDAQMDEIAELYPSTIICTNDKDDADLL